MRILVRTSRWAIWARRIGSLALPVAFILVLMHRGNAITTQSFAVVEAVAIVMALVALGCAIMAFVRIWITGDHGWGKAVVGFLCGLVCLVPLGLWSFDYFRYPMVDEVSTDQLNPPPLISQTIAVPPSPAVMQAISKAFPNIKTRGYPIDPAAIFRLVSQLVAGRQWKVERQLEPAPGQAGQINAIATTLFGFRDEVSIRIAAVSGGSSVAMRSVSLSTLHEPGVNGSRIESFLTALDDRVTARLKNLPAGSDIAADADTDTDAAPVPAVPMPNPPIRGKRR